jgi:hypothetical protein
MQSFLRLALFVTIGTAVFAQAPLRHLRLDMGLLTLRGQRRRRDSVSRIAAGQP